MVIKVTVPEGVRYNRLIEGVMAERYKLKRLTLLQYKDIGIVSKILNIPESFLFTFAKSSKRLHACELPDGSILFHPDSVTNEIRSRMQTLIRKELRA